MVLRRPLAPAFCLFRKTITSEAASSVGGLFHFKRNVRCLLLADIVAKRIFASQHATLIQEMDPSRRFKQGARWIRTLLTWRGRRLLQQYRHLADNPNAPAFVRY